VLTLDLARCSRAVLLPQQKFVGVNLTTLEHTTNRSVCTILSKYTCFETHGMRIASHSCASNLLSLASAPAVLRVAQSKS
jgi:hypothetical protein